MQARKKSFVLLRIDLHDARLLGEPLESREECTLFRVVMMLDHLDSCTTVEQEVLDILGGVDGWHLQVDAVKPADQDVVGVGHFRGALVGRM